MDCPLYFEVIAKCKKTRARVGNLRLKSTSEFGKDVEIETPIFMPVGTSGAMKSVMPIELEQIGCRLMLCNTYHLASQPGEDIVNEIGHGGCHGFIRWPHAILTDSGGFQMVSLNKLMSINEDGVRFESPYNEGEIFLSPEGCMQIQHKLGSNIIMQLDDVVSAVAQDDKRFEEALYRSIRWYDRARKYHHQTGRDKLQNLYPIIQGGLDESFRRISVREIVARDPPGIAIGGLSGGEAKEDFIKMVAISTENLSDSKPRYLMGVGYAVDMMLCVALGCDQFDCVYPTRTARFGTALIGLGKQLNLSNQRYLTDQSPVDQDCDCSTCLSLNRSYLCRLFRSKNPTACQLLTVHNLRFQMRFMEMIRLAIKEQRFEQFIIDTLYYNIGKNYNDYPEWIRIALDILQIDLINL
ncbi:tRNA-guanine transglycosylase [Dermatophagoides pteronyssinus]|uniref:Queuine tRNA-ribosyltransferase catalytic subunit 1 n=2 Tax=Dermatophagoides pteronyssinus TaxID=6956 RepID=A0A6P6XWI1_DERPT|nr:queuine tRNA-ribosyltransferase catalytic subunit 1-like [Dermatophagoides pteronyssinus]KAH9427033.1 Queuine tRNA-ribosyltransferase catalytic subunit 1 [Dermatophagoides pteronyssinus]